MVQRLRVGSLWLALVLVFDVGFGRLVFQAFVGVDCGRSLRARYIIQRTFRVAGLTTRLRWLEPGVPTRIIP